ATGEKPVAVFCFLGAPASLPASKVFFRKFAGRMPALPGISSCCFFAPPEAYASLIKPPLFEAPSHSHPLPTRTVRATTLQNFFHFSRKTDRKTALVTGECSNGFQLSSVARL